IVVLNELLTSCSSSQSSGVKATISDPELFGAQSFVWRPQYSECPTGMEVRPTVWIYAPAMEGVPSTAAAGVGAVARVRAMSPRNATIVFFIIVISPTEITIGAGNCPDPKTATQF